MSEQQSDSKERISRRSFLKIGAAGAGAALGYILGKGLHVDAGQEVEESEDIFERLSIKIRSSDLRESGTEEVISKERLLTFVDRCEEANNYLEQIHNHKEKIEEISSLARRLYPNPNIKIENNIPFLRDEGFLKKALERLDSLDWGASRGVLEEKAKEILIVPPSMHSLSDEVISPDKWPTTPENLSRIYSQAGKREYSSTFSVLFPEDTDLNEMQRLSLVVHEALTKIGPPPETKAYLLPANDEAQIPFWGHAVFEEVTASAKLELGVLTQGRKPEFYDKLVGDITVHESAHAMDVDNRLGLVQFLSPTELLDLYIFRLNAFLDTYIPEATEVGERRFLRSQRVDGRSIDNTYYRYWIFSNILDSDQLSKEEWEILVHLYSNERWSFSGMAFLSEPVYRLSEIQRNVSLPPEKQGYYNSWEEFFRSEQQIFGELIKAQKEGEHLVEFITGKIKESPSDFSEDYLAGQPASNWWSNFWYLNFRLIIAQDLIQKGEVKNYIPENTYKEWISRVPFELRASLSEKFADEVALYLYLKSLGPVSDWLEEIPAMKYYEKAKKIFGTK